MSKRARFILVLLVVAIATVFLYPTGKWYFGVGKDAKAIATGSREQIRNFSQTKAAEDLRQWSRRIRIRQFQLSTASLRTRQLPTIS